MFAEVFSKEAAVGMRQPLVTGAPRAGHRSWPSGHPRADWAVQRAGRAVLRSAVREKQGVASFGKGPQLAAELVAGSRQPQPSSQLLSQLLFAGNLQAVSSSTEVSVCERRRTPVPRR